MAADLNRCEFIGRLGRDVELKEMKNGEFVANFSIAVNDSWTSKSGEKIKKTEWINIVAYRKLAEICNKYLAKGHQVYISGKFTTNKYTGKDGTEKTSIQIVLETLQMLGIKSSTEASPIEEEEEEEMFDDTIPF